MLWERQYQLAIDPDTARQVRSKRAPADSMACTMCGEYCALKMIKKSIDLDPGEVANPAGEAI